MGKFESISARNTAIQLIGGDLPEDWAQLVAPDVQPADNELRERMRRIFNIHDCEGPAPKAVRQNSVAVMQGDWLYTRIPDAAAPLDPFRYRC